MANKLTLVMVTLISVASLAMCWLLWQAVDSTQRSQSQQLTEQRELLVVIAEKLALQPPPPTAPAATWTDVTVKLVGEHGEPVAGQVTLNQYFDDKYSPIESSSGSDAAKFPPADALELEAAADEQGIAKLHSVPFGKYWLHVRNENARMDSVREVLVRPGAAEFEVVTPPQPLPSTTVRLELVPPEDLREAPFHYVADLYAPGEVEYGGTLWRRLDVPLQELVFGPDGQPLGKTRYLSSAQVGAARMVATQVSLRDLAPVTPEPLLTSTLHLGLRIFTDTGMGRSSGRGLPSGRAGFVTLNQGQLTGRNGFWIKDLPLVSNGETVITIGPDHAFWNDVREFQAAAPSGPRGRAGARSYVPSGGDSRLELPWSTLLRNN